MEKQRTIKNEISISGTGLHTGQEVTLTFKPAPENYGYRFVRVDIDQDVEIKALADYVVDTSRGTTLEYNGSKVFTIEHVLAALVGLQIDNVRIEMDGAETPILDGSSRLYIEALEKAGFEDQNAERIYFEIKENISFQNTEEKGEFLAVPSDEYRLSTMIDYGLEVLGTQHASINHIGEFKEEISKARTFVFLHELEYLLKNNLIKGGDLANAIVYVDKPVEQDELDRLANLFDKPSVKVTDKGYLNNLELFSYNEPARHKLLDIIGDLALVGKPIKGHIIASRPGHKNNTNFARKLRKIMKEEAHKKNMPVFPADAQPLFDINDIMEKLPHRPPFLLIDRIMEMSDTHVVGSKAVTMNEPFFVGHFPGNPVMPGVLQIEAMAQTGGILVLSTVPDPENYITLFMKIDKVKFRNQVVPGDTIHFSLRLLSPIRRGLCHMEGVAYVGSKVVMEAEMLAQIVKKK
jgi:UDP-3-O-[3-hydroxymyristoyl] N-acetylglucosamine deacetylase/3-hydroxyacyl-[acyl-carrier-protein] dehydratase